MNDAQITELGQKRQPSSGAATYLAFALVFAARKRLIVGVPMIVAVFAAAISFAIPNVYKASTKLLPPQQSQSGAAALLSQLGGVAGFAAGVTGLKNPNDLYIGMLKSRTIADKLIAQFNLKQAYDSKLQEKTRRELEANTVITSGKDGLITVEVEGTDRKLVAPLANAYIAELLKLTRVLAVTEASKRRVFFEQQLELSKDNLFVAETALKRALDVKGVISVDGESRAIVETIGRLRAQVSAKEIQLNSMTAFVTPANPTYRRAEEELNSLRAELSKLENGRGGEMGNATVVPGKQEGLENIKLLRDVKYYQMLYELLAKQYEVARLDEAKDPSVIQVLDPAIEPELKSGPKRAIIVILSTLGALVVSIFTAFILETNRAMRKLGHKKSLKTY
jgi:uncharacterized protein involved in exopolysaccharide biosynthesis